MKQEQWKIELLDSPLWLVQSFFGVLLFCLIAAFLLRRTTFGQRFERILRPCLASSNRIRVCLLLAALLLMVLLEVRISVLNSFFYKGLYDSLQDRAAAAFWFFAGINSA